MSGALAERVHRAIRTATIAAAAFTGGGVLILWLVSSTSVLTPASRVLPEGYSFQPYSGVPVLTAVVCATAMLLVVLIAAGGLRRDRSVVVASRKAGK